LGFTKEKKSDFKMSADLLLRSGAIEFSGPYTKITDSTVLIVFFKNITKNEEQKVLLSKFKIFSQTIHAFNPFNIPKRAGETREETFVKCINQWNKFETFLTENRESLEAIPAFESIVSETFEAIGDFRKQEPDMREIWELVKRYDR